MNSLSARRRTPADNDRYAAFTFASSHMVVEVDADGAVTYAAGAFRTVFGRAPETFLGLNVRTMIGAIDHEAMGAALSLLLVKGRLLPQTIRMANGARTRLAMAGLARPVPGDGARLCLSFALLPAALDGRILLSGHGLVRAAEARLRDGVACDLGLMALEGVAVEGARLGALVGAALQEVAPGMMASKVAPGRFGVLDMRDGPVAPGGMVGALERRLVEDGVCSGVRWRWFPVLQEGLTVLQGSRALRQAVSAFARDGEAGLEAAGFGWSGLAGGLVGYVEQARRHEAALREQIAGGGFEVWYQPIVSLPRRRVHRYEALIRPGPLSGRAITPQDFVMLAETAGLAEQLDLAVAQRVCEAACEAGANVAVNISSQSAQSPRFRVQFLGMLADTRARERGLISVEITETAEIGDVAEAALMAQALRDLQVPVCLDDFGGGAADVRLLRALQPESVKLDGSYIAGLGEGEQERGFVTGVAEVARAAGAEVGVEKVETEEDAAVLAEIGVDYGQGLLFGRPGPGPIRPRNMGRRLARVAERCG